MKTKTYIGLDVHKNSIIVATAAADGSPPQHDGKWGGSNLAAERGLLKLLKKSGLEKGEVSVAYEAGPSGFVLARRLEQLGYECIVVAPSEVPGKPGERVKTDRRDARKLARLLRAGDLEGIHIPDAADEAVRDLCRARTDASQALSRCKQQLAMFLLRNGSRYDGKTTWTQEHMNYLRKLRLAHPAQQLVLEEWCPHHDAPLARPQGEGSRDGPRDGPESIPLPPEGLPAALGTPARPEPRNTDDRVEGAEPAPPALEGAGGKGTAPQQGGRRRRQGALRVPLGAERQGRARTAPRGGVAADPTPGRPAGAPRAPPAATRNKTTEPYTTTNLAGIRRGCRER